MIMGTNHIAEDVDRKYQKKMQEDILRGSLYWSIFLSLKIKQFWKSMKNTIRVNSRRLWESTLAWIEPKSYHSHVLSCRNINGQIITDHPRLLRADQQAIQGSLEDLRVRFGYPKLLFNQDGVKE